MLTRTQAEDFLFAEAELLDDWQLQPWAALFTEDAVYEIAVRRNGGVSFGSMFG